MPSIPSIILTNDSLQSPEDDFSGVFERGSFFLRIRQFAGNRFPNLTAPFKESLEAAGLAPIDVEASAVTLPFELPFQFPCGCLIANQASVIGFTFVTFFSDSSAGLLMGDQRRNLGVLRICNNATVSMRGLIQGHIVELSDGTLKIEEGGGEKRPIGILRVSSGTRGRLIGPGPGKDALHVEYRDASDDDLELSGNIFVRNAGKWDRPIVPERQIIEKCMNTIREFREIENDLSAVRHHCSSEERIIALSSLLVRATEAETPFSQLLNQWYDYAKISRDTHQTAGLISQRKTTQENYRIHQLANRWILTEPTEQLIKRARNLSWDIGRNIVLALRYPNRGNNRGHLL
jgi:hypothetical protein